MNRSVKSSPESPRQWRSSNLGLLSVGFWFLFACSLVPAGVLLACGFYLGNYRVLAAATALPLTFVAAERLVVVFDERQLRIDWSVGLWFVGLTALVVLGFGQEPREPFPGPGDDVATVLERLGPPYRDSRLEEPGRSEIYTLYFNAPTVRFAGPTVYVVDFEQDRVADLHVWSR